MQFVQGHKPVVVELEFEHGQSYLEIHCISMSLLVYNTQIYIKWWQKYILHIDQNLGTET